MSEMQARGKNINVGCGVVFVNYDGKNKFKTVVGDNCFIGSGSNLVAPLQIEEENHDRCWLYNHKKIFLNIGMAIARARQEKQRRLCKKIALFE